MKPDQKECPFCFEVIRSRATVCRYCRQPLPAVAPESRPESVPDDAVTAARISELLTSLIERSLVVYDAQARRYRLLETVRDYTAERLAERGQQAATRERHLSWFLELARAAELGMRTAEQGLWLSRLDQEYENVRAALTYGRSGGPGAAGGAMRLAGALFRYWHTRGLLGEGRAWIDSLLRADTTGGADRGAALAAAGSLAWAQADYSLATEFYEECLALKRKLGDAPGVANALGNLGLTAKSQGNYRRARELYDECLDNYRAAGERWGVANTLVNLGLLLYEQGEYSRAGQLYEESLDLWRELGDRQARSNALNNLGLVASELGDHARADRLFEESLSIRQELGDRRGTASSLANQAIAAQGRGDSVRAHALHMECLEINRAIGDRHGVGVALTNLGALAVDRADFAQARTLFREALVILRKIGDVRGVAIALSGLSEAAAGLGEMERAALMAGAAQAIREASGAAVPRAGRAPAEHHLAAARESLGELRLASAISSGRALSLDEAVAIAMDDEASKENIS